MADDRLLSIRDAAALLQRSTKSLRNYVKSGRLSAEKVPGPKGPQFVFRAAQVEQLAKELRLDVAEHIVHPDAAPAAETSVPMNVPSSVPALVEAFLVSERERTRLLQRMAETAHTLGALEERVSQLQHRLKREEKIAGRSKDLEKELRAWKKRVETRDEKLKRMEELRAATERKYWWQVWRPRFDDPGYDEA